jgi:hypothetical protein
MEAIFGRTLGQNNVEITELPCASFPSNTTRRLPMSIERERVSPTEDSDSNDVQQQLDSVIAQHGNSSIAGAFGNAIIGAEIQATGPVRPPSQTEMQTEQTLNELISVFRARS